MESWSFVSEESVSVDDGTSRGKNGWELNTPCSLRNNYVGIVNQDFSNLGSQLPNNQIRDALSSYKLGGGRGFVSGEKESSSKSSSSVMESNTKDSSLIDLKLGRFAEQNFKSPKIMQDLCFNVSSVPAKRYRGLNSQTSFCQVQGCGKDLSSSKDYHKRHKVCDVHSKTAKVIVKGIEQRFCQQCSRFHLLAEFDDGKRSCRKRLAGHNERRRKPHAGLHSGRTGRLFQSYAGARFQGTSFATTSPFVCQDALGCSLLHQPRLDINGWYKNVKVEPVSDYSSQLTMPFRPLFTSYHAEKHCPAPQGEGMTRNKNNESSNSYVTDMGGSDFVSRSLFHSTSMGSEVLNVMDSPSTFQGISNSGCALSLLSSQSQTGNSSNYSSLVPNAHHLITPSNNADYHAVQTSEKFPGGIMSSIFNSAEGRLEQILSNSCSVNGSIQGSEYVNTKNLLSCEDGPTIDLLQLSSQLHQVENQRHSMK